MGDISNVQKHMGLCNELNNTYKSKNKDYGNSFGETYQKLGIVSAVSRIYDKCNRLVTLCTKPEGERKVKDESLRDTLMDMANYCLLTVIELDEQMKLSEKYSIETDIEEAREMIDKERYHESIKAGICKVPCIRVKS
jgi:hypothetical protein